MDRNGSGRAVGEGIQGALCRDLYRCRGNETDRGPWTAWFSNEPYALPKLYNIPVDKTARAVKRRVYRQFYADVVDHDPNAGVDLVGELDDNTEIALQDQLR